MCTHVSREVQKERLALNQEPPGNNNKKHSFRMFPVLPLLTMVAIDRSLICSGNIAGVKSKDHILYAQAAWLEPHRRDYEWH